MFIIYFRKLNIVYGTVKLIMAQYTEWLKKNCHTKTIIFFQALIGISSPVLCIDKYHKIFNEDLLLPILFLKQNHHHNKIKIVINLIKQVKI